MQDSRLASPQIGGITLPAGAWHYPSLDAIIFAGCGLALLFIGTWVPNPRLNFNGVPIDSIVLAFITLLVTLGSTRPETLRTLAILQLPLLLLGITIIWSPVPALGLENLTSLVFISFLAFLLFNTVIERHGEVELLRVLLLFLIADLFAAIAYKAIFGFFDRTVMFFLNGPIVFGRFMSIGLILSLFAYRGLFRIVAATAFYLAIVWTESKGPIISATLTVLALFWLSAGRRGKLILIFSCVAVAFVFLAAVARYGISIWQIGRLAILVNALSGDTTLPMLLSASGRTSLWTEAVGLIFSYPMGIGLGGWSYYNESVDGASYPHNLFLELWCEGGIVLGTLACIPLLIFLQARRSVFWFVALCLLMAQMVSGNISDARQMYVFSLLAIFRRTATQDSLSGAIGLSQKQHVSLPPNKAGPAETY